MTLLYFETNPGFLLVSCSCSHTRWFESRSVSRWVWGSEGGSRQGNNTARFSWCQALRDRPDARQTKYTEIGAFSQMRSADKEHKYEIVTVTSRRWLADIWEPDSYCRIWFKAPVSRGDIGMTHTEQLQGESSEILYQTKYLNVGHPKKALIFYLFFVWHI